MDPTEEKSPVNLKLQIKEFFTLQEERVKTYKTFDEGFKLYLNGTPEYDFLQYRQHVHEITQKFIELSKSIRGIENTLKNSDRDQLAGIIRKIQLKEKEKLDLTAKLQIKEKDCREHPEEDYTDDLTALKSSLQGIIEDINEFLQDLKYECEDILLEETDEQEPIG